MRNRNKPTNRRPAWVEMFAKTRGGDTAADGRDWHTDVPNIKLSRAFVVVLVLHVVALGGIIAFEVFKPEGDAAAVAEVKSEAQTKRALTADTPAAAAPRKETPAMRRDSERGGYESYIVQAGDSIRAVASQYGISRTELLTANQIDEQHPLVAGRLLRIPKALLPGGSSANLQHVSAERDVRTGAPGLTSAIDAEAANVLPVPEPIQIGAPEMDDDGFQSVPETVEPANSTYQPAPVVASEENAPVTIVAPRTNTKPKVTRVVPRALPVTPEPAASSARTHAIAAGETLYGVSRKYGVSVDALLAANPGVKPSSLGIGQRIRIP